MAYCLASDRRSPTQLKQYDHAAVSAHFIALYAYQQACPFGDLFNGAVQLNTSGQTIRDHWLSLPERYPNLYLDEFAVTPSRIHGILLLDRPASRPSIVEIVDEFKAGSTQQLSRMHQRSDLVLWQRNACSLAIRNNTTLQILRYYIQVACLSR